MQASAGDKVIMHSRTVGEHERVGTVLETHGKDGDPPFLVRFEDGHEALVFPGPDVHVQHASRA